MSVNVYDGDKEKFVDGNIFDFFNYVVGRSCDRMNMMEPNIRNKDSWQLLKVIYPDANIIFLKCSLF